MLRFGREVTGDFDIACRREWLVTNGLGGWASGTVAGANTRRYHGLFVPALQPPLGRAVLVGHLNELVVIGGQAFPLSSNEYGDGTIHPDGFRHIESFRLDGQIPTWRYALAEALLEKRVWMPYGQDATFVTYQVVRGRRPVRLEVALMLAGRDAHTETKHGLAPDPTIVLRDDGVHIVAAGCHFRVAASAGVFTVDPVWHYTIKHRAETERGLPDREDQLSAGRFVVDLGPGQTWAITMTTAPVDLDWASSLARERARSTALIDQAGLAAEPAWIQQLVLAADQFLVQRGAGRTVIAGYHWFGDWGRDTMIALPGLALATRRYDEAAGILRTFAGFVSQGMLPNRFPDHDDAPEYNTVDATLWYFHAVEAYIAVTGDLDLARELLPVLEEIVTWHLRGTRYQIGVDPQDGLLRAGQAGVQLTWMDAKVGDHVITPRIGKPVEINALWINALFTMDVLCRRLGQAGGHDYRALADAGAAGFEKFWYEAGGWLYDVIDGPDGNDLSLRPNQLFAISLPHAPLRQDSHRDRARTIVEVCTQHLQTSFGLRSLSANDPQYVANYRGDSPARDAAYHQGTVWGWLIGPMVDAHLWAFGDPALARCLLAPFEHHLLDYGLGSVAEIFQPEAPFTPCGAIAQAWSVAEVLRAWVAVRDAA